MVDAFSGPSPSQEDEERPAVIATNIINGISFPPFIDQKKIDDLVDFPLLPTDLFIVTYPKCGTTWVQQIVSLVKKQVGIVGGGQEGDSTHIFDSMPWIELVGRDVAMKTPVPRTLKSHNPYHMMAGGDPSKSVAKYIYVARNPKDVAVSFYHHVKHYKGIPFNGDWNTYFEIYFMKGELGFGQYYDHVLEWWKHRDADNILFLKYEDMKKDLPGAVKIISQFMGYDLDPAVIDKISQECTIDSMRSNQLVNPDYWSKTVADIVEGTPSFLRKGVVGDWRNHFSDEQAARLDAEYDKRWYGSGLEFEV